MMNMNDEINAVKKVCRQQVTGMVTKDLELLDAIIAPTAVFEHITGVQQSKLAWLQQISNGRMTYFGSEELQLTVVVTGPAATATMTNRLDARIYGFRNQWPLASVISLTKTHGQWQIVKAKANLAREAAHD